MVRPDNRKWEKKWLGLRANFIGYVTRVDCGSRRRRGTAAAARGGTAVSKEAVARKIETDERLWKGRCNVSERHCRKAYPCAQL